MSFTKKKLKKYYEKEALLGFHQKYYVESTGWESFYHGRRWNIILNCLSSFQPRVFMDVGCAEGLYLEAVKNLFKDRFLTIGTDVSKNYLLKAKKANRASEYVLCDAEYLPFKGNAFDITLCSEVIEHTLNPSRVFEEVEKVTRRKIVFSFPSTNLTTYLLRRLNLIIFASRFANKAGLNIVESEIPNYGHISEINLEDVLSWSETRSLTVEKWFTYGSKLIPIGLISRLQEFFIPVFTALEKTLSHLPAMKRFGSGTVVLLEKSEKTVTRAKMVSE